MSVPPIEPDRRPICGAILAGGGSRRMGRDKAELSLGDSTFLEHLLEACHGVVDDLVVAGRASDTVDARLQRKFDVEFVPDDQPDLGPLGGLATALRHTNAPTVLLACDMPLVDRPTIEWLVERWRDPPTDGSAGLVGRHDGQPAPFFSVYRPTILSAVDAMLDEGILALRALIRREDFDTLALPARISRRLVNINTPEDYRAVVGSRPDLEAESPFPFWQVVPK